MLRLSISERVKDGEKRNENPGPRNFQLELGATLVPNRVGSALYKLLIFQYLGRLAESPASVDESCDVLIEQQNSQ